MSRIYNGMHFLGITNNSMIVTSRKLGVTLGMRQHDQILVTFKDSTALRGGLVLRLQNLLAVNKVLIGMVDASIT